MGVRWGSRRSYLGLIEAEVAGSWSERKTNDPKSQKAVIATYFFNQSIGLYSALFFSKYFGKHNFLTKL